MSVSLKADRPKGGSAYRTSGNGKPELWRCSNPFPLTCAYHGNEIEVPCGRWRTCAGCGRRIQWQLAQRFLAGISKVPENKTAMFFTLTFPLYAAPDETGAHSAFRAFTRRLRYRGHLGAYGWVLQRQENGTLHYHGIAHLPYFDDDLEEWRELLIASGFGVQNKLKVAKPQHARYTSNYIGSRLATVQPFRRAYSFSQDFPHSEWEEARRRSAEGDKVLRQILSAEPLCEWMPSGQVAALLNR